jgi:hypothetical protein
MQKTRDELVKELVDYYSSPELNSPRHRELGLSGLTGFLAAKRALEGSGSWEPGEKKKALELYDEVERQLRKRDLRAALGEVPRDESGTPMPIADPRNPNREAVQERLLGLLETYRQGGEEALDGELQNLFPETPEDPPQENSVPSIVTHQAYDEADRIVGRRVGFFLGPLLVLGSFADEPHTNWKEVFDSDNHPITCEERLASDNDVDLHLVSVASHDLAGHESVVRLASGFPEAGGILRCLCPDGSVALRFRGIRQLPEWGTVLRISPEEDSAADQLIDGAPLLNEDGELVGVLRDRTPAHIKLRVSLGFEAGVPEVRFGLPASRLFPLFQEALTNKMRSVDADLRLAERWKDWKAKNWDEEQGMTHAEYDTRKSLEATQAEAVAQRETIQRLRNWWRRRRRRKQAETESEPERGVWLLKHCEDSDCRTITVSMIDPEIREVKEIQGGLAPVIDIDVDQALDMAETLVKMTRERLAKDK